MLKQDILTYIHKKRQVTRKEICKQFNTGVSAVSSNIKNLISEGLIIENGFRASTGGRPSADIKLNPLYTAGVGIEVSRRGVKGLKTAFDGTVLEEIQYSDDSFASAGSVESGLGIIRKCITGLISKEKVSGIGIAISGIVEKETGVSVSFPDFPQWERVQLKSILQDEFGIPVRIEPLICAAVRGELYYGAGNGHENFLYIHLGKGLSCGAVFKGEIYRSTSGYGGELGHTFAVPDGPLCYCGKYGCLESVASPLYIEKAVAQAVAEGVATSASGNGAISMESILEAAGKGDKLAGNVIEKAAGHIGRAASNLCNIFAPDALIMGGEYVDEDNYFFSVVEREFRSHVMDSCRSCTMLPGKLRDKAALTGACDLTLVHVFS